MRSKGKHLQLHKKLILFVDLGVVDLHTLVLKASTKRMRIFEQNFGRILWDQEIQ